MFWRSQQPGVPSARGVRALGWKPGFALSGEVPSIQAAEFVNESMTQDTGRKSQEL
jgi:hypothetical protein